MRRTAAILIVTQLVWGSACATKTPVTLASSPPAASQATQVVHPWENVALVRGNECSSRPWPS